MLGQGLGDSWPLKQDCDMASGPFHVLSCISCKVSLKLMRWLCDLDVSTRSHRDWWTLCAWHDRIVACDYPPRACCKCSRACLSVDCSAAWTDGLFELSMVSGHWLLLLHHCQSFFRPHSKSSVVCCGGCLLTKKLMWSNMPQTSMKRIRCSSLFLVIESQTYLTTNQGHKEIPNRLSTKNETKANQRWRIIQEAGRGKWIPYEGKKRCLDIENVANFFVWYGTHAVEIKRIELNDQFC